LVGFLRAIKNTFVPMVVFACGAVVFVIVDYLLIFGACGMPQLCLFGSAVASLVQYAFMSVVMILYILYSQKHEKYNISILKSKFSWCRTGKLLWVSVPVVIDKVSIAFAYAWLGSCMSHLGATAGAAFSCIKMMERFAFLPAIASAQVITFLVSNDVGKGNWDDIHANIKRVLIIATVMVGTILLIGSIWPSWFVTFFDKKNEFGYLVAIIFPALSVLILIDLLQLVLSAALRGAGDVQTVMFTRAFVISCYFIPATYVISWFSFDAMVTKMLVTYATFLLGNALMSMVYVYRLRQNHWKKQKVKACNG
jgi:MATE family multidrug resistance protein